MNEMCKQTRVAGASLIFSSRCCQSQHGNSDVCVFAAVLWVGGFEGSFGMLTGWKRRKSFKWDRKPQLQFTEITFRVLSAQAADRLAANRRNIFSLAAAFNN